MEVNITPVDVKKARKRTRNECNWKRNVKKRERYAPKRPPPIKDLGRCKHKGGIYQCNQLNIQDVRKFHESFYAKHDKIYQDNFILKHMKIKSPKRHPRRQNSSRKDSVTFTKMYMRTSVKPYKLIRICQRVLILILGITVHRIRSIAKKYLLHGKLPTENRGGDRVSMKNESKKNNVMRFIEKFTCIESHYCRSATSVRKYVSSDLNIKKMWRLYQSEQNEDNLKVRLCYFRNIFNRNYNIGFKTPRVDVCSKCMELTEKIKRDTNTNTKNALMMELRLHKLKAKCFYEFLRQQKESMLTLSYDCQKNQVLPKVPDQAAYYSRQLYINNFTIVVGTSTRSIKKDNVFIYTWTENVHAKASNEIASAIFYQLSQTNLRGINHIRLMGDGCGSQNKNSIIIAMCAHWLTVCAATEIKKIEIIFPVPGHSFMPADRVFGLIEKEIKNIEQIIDPEEYLKIYENYGQVIKLGVDCQVKDWKTYGMDLLKPPAQYHFQFAKCKRFYLTRVKKRTGRFMLRGEINYKVDTGVAKSIIKRNVETMLDAGIRTVPPFERTISVLKCNDVDKLLIKHFGNDWKTALGSGQLSFYYNILSNEHNSYNEHNVEEEDNCEYLEEAGMSI